MNYSLFHSPSPPRLITLILLTALAVLSVNMFSPSLINIANTFEIDVDVVGISIAGYLAITGLLQLIMGPLSDRYGRRPVMLSSLIIFIFASIGCYLATDIWSFLAFRMLQGAIITGMALSRAIVRDMVSTQEAVSLIGYITTAMAIAPMLGPLFGGLLDEYFGWKASFLAFIILGCVLFILCWFDLGETNKNKSETFLQQFQSYPELFKSRRFWGYSVCMAGSIGAFYAFIAGAPIAADNLFTLSPSVVGFYTGSISIGFLTGTYLGGRFGKDIALNKMVFLGRFIASFGMLFAMMLQYIGFHSHESFFLPVLLVGFGNGLTIPGASAGVLSVRPHLAGSAAGLSGALVVALGAIVTWLTGNLLSHYDSRYILHAVMFMSSFLGLLAIIYVILIDRNESKTA